MFMAIEAVAVNYYVTHSSSYNSARFLSVSNSVVGWAHTWVSGVKSYFGLQGENRLLLEEVALLRDELGVYREAMPHLRPDVAPPYFYSTARVVNNSITRYDNFFTIDKGDRDGIDVKDAILTPDGAIVGYVLASSDKFSVCMSALNTDFRTSGNLKGTDDYGAVFWNGRSREYITMSEVSRYSSVHQGDTVLTTNYSSIFPPGLMIGTVDEFELSSNSTYFDVKVRLAANFASLGDVLVVKYADAGEREELENSVTPEETTNTARR